MKLNEHKIKNFHQLREFTTKIREEATQIASDRIITSTDLLWVKTATQEFIDDMYTRQNIGRNLVDVINIDATQFTWNEEDNVFAKMIPEMGEVELSRISTIQRWVKTFKTGIAFGMTDEAMKDGSVDMWARNLRKHTIAMSDLEDTFIMKCLSDSVPNGTAITLGVGGFGHEVASHIIPGGTNPTNILTYDAIVDASVILDVEGVTANIMLIHPRQKGELMKMEEFISSTQAAYLTLPGRLEQQMANGFIGNMLNMQCVVSNNVVPGEALLFDKSRYGILLEREPVHASNFEDWWTDNKYLKLIAKYAPACLDRDACVKINQLNQM